MDGLSVAASIAGLVSLADSIFRTTVRYVKRAKGARHEVDDLLNEVKNFSILLHNLSLVTYELETSPSVDNTFPLPPANLRLHYLHDCRQLLNRLDKGLEDLKKDIESPSALSRLQGHLKWPFKSTETLEIVRSIQRQKQTISLAVSADSFHQLKQLLSRQEDASKRLNVVQATISEILDIETKIILNQAKREVLEFFAKEANPRPDFELNRKLRHPLTGVWFTESLNFQEWYSNPGSRIWISGIPGAGKSVLAGAIIMQCLQISSENEKVALAYFFCSYKDNKTHLASNILSSLASQIAMQNEAAFQVLQEYYEELRSHKQLSGEPSSDRLLEIIGRMSTLFDQMFIIVDGLDECETHTDDVVHNLADLSISRDSGIITTALLSRDELSIRFQLEPLFINIDIAAHTEDIQLYVASELDKRTGSKRLRLRDISLKDQIMTELVNGAKGMFRWVACQLDHLCELPTDKARRDALTKLPPTLPASYERILRKVESSTNQVQNIVQRSLQLIALSSRVRLLSIQQICEAVSVSIDQDTFEDDEIVDADEIMRWCSSLIRKSVDCRRFEFAHYSVMKFLEGICSTHPKLDSYHVSVSKGFSLLAPICLRYLTVKNHEEGPLGTKSDIHRMRERNITRPFYEHAAIWWPVFFWGSLEKENATTQQLLYTLFDMKKTESFTSWALELARHCLLHKGRFCYEDRDDFGRDEQTALTVISAIVRPDFTPLHMASALGLSSVCRRLLEQGARIDISSRFGAPIHCATGGLNVFVDGPMSLRSGGGGSEVLDPAARYRTTEILLDAKANTSLHLVTPFRQETILSLAIQSSEYGEDFEIVTSLVRAGVEVEDDDLPLFDNRYSDTMKYTTPKYFKAKYAGGKAIMSLLKALGIPEKDKSNPRSRLYALTFKFAKAMQLELDDSLPNILPEASANEDTVREFIKSTIKSNDAATMERFLESGRLDVIKTADFSSNNSVKGWSVLHLCIEPGSIDILKLLLEAGCEPDTANEDGVTPTQLCYEDGDKDMLRLLLEYGASTISQDDTKLETIWHTSAYENSTQILKLLIELDQNKDTALKMRSRLGRTPICEALALGNRETVLLLLSHCVSAEYWKSDIPFFQTAAELGSTSIIQTLLDVGLPLDELDSNVGSPLHFLSVDATVECTKLLVVLFPHCHIRCREGRTPFESLLVRSIEDDVEVDPDIFKELLKGFNGSEWQGRGNLWPSICSSIVPYAFSTGWGVHWTKQLLSRLFEVGVVEAYEDEHMISSLVPLAEDLETIGSSLSPRAKGIRGGIFSQATEKPLTLNHWPWLSEVFSELANTTSQWENMLAQPPITQLLSWAIIHNDTGIIELLLKNGLDIHNRVNGLSALELACLPEVAIDEDNFARLLTYAQPDKLRATNEKVLGLNVVHLTAIGPFKDRGLWKLKQLLVAGADSDACSSLNDGVPAVISVQISGVLLHKFDVALAAVMQNNSSLLKIIAQLSDERNVAPIWERTWNRYFDGAFFSGGNAIHLAAMYDAVECLEFYINEGLLHDLEPLDNDMETPMHYAARFNRCKTIRFLQSNGCSVNIQARFGYTPLHLAIHLKHLDAVALLLKMGTDMEACAHGMTPLAYAYKGGDYNVIKLLKSHGGQDDASDSSNPNKDMPILVETLYAAIDRNDVRACEDLRSQGCPVDCESKGFWRATPLMIALCRRKDPGVVKWLVNCGATTTAVFQKAPWHPYITILEAAVSTPLYNETLAMLLTIYFEQGGNLLRLPRGLLETAVKSRNHDGLKILVKELRRKYGVEDIPQPRSGYRMTKSEHDYHASINQPNKENNGSTAISEAASLGSMEDLEHLIENGADVNMSGSNGSTPLHHAACSGSGKAVKLLLKHGAQLEPRDKWGATPLNKALRHGYFDIVKLLISHREPGNHSNYFGDNLLFPVLLHPSDHSYDVAMWKFLCDRGVDPHQVNCIEHSAIHIVLSNPSRGVLKHVMRQSPSQQWITRVEWSLVLLRYLPRPSEWNKLDVITDNYRLICRYAGSSPPLRIPNSVTTGEGSLFHIAASWGFVQALDNLLTIGADLEQELGHSGTALTTSAAHGHLEAVKHLFRRKSRAISEQIEVITGAIAAAREYEEIVHWFLVERYIDQRKIAPCELKLNQEGVQLRHWSGIQSFAVPLRWEWKQRRGESMMEYAKRRREIVLSLQGNVAE